MPKFKGRITPRGNWDENKMKQAIRCVLEKKISVREAAERYDVPRSTLQDRIKAVGSGQEAQFKPTLGRYEHTFSENQSLQLYNHVKDLDNRLMPLTKVEFLKLAFQFAERLKIPHRFNKEKKMAGKDFYYSFIKKYPDIALRSPESTSIARAVGFNKPQVYRFYDQLHQLQDKYKFPASRIYNADETGVSTVHKNEKVISTKGKKQVGKLTSGERGRNITLMFAMSVCGHFIPPLFIFPRKRMDKNGRLMIGAPPDSIAIPHESGWMNGEIFLMWLQHFKQHVQPSKENPVLLILDGHGSHKELAVIEFARANHIHMISTPPHTTHKVKPLDRVFFKPFKSAFGSASAMWMRQNPGARITDYDIAALVNSAFVKAARLEIAQNGFKCTGIYPFNREIFSDLDFLPSLMTNIEQEPAFSEETVVGSQLSTSCNQQKSRCCNQQSSSSGTQQPSTSCTQQPSTSCTQQPSTSCTQQPSTSSNQQPSTSLISHPSASGNTQPSFMPASTSEITESTAPATVNELLKQLSPLPDASKRRLAARSRKTQKSEILTSSPFKNALVEKKAATNTTKAATNKTTTNKRKAATNKMKTKKNIQSLTQLERDHDTECIICGETFEEDWIQCHRCKDWAHEACVDIDPSLAYYYCDVCKAKERFGHQ
ncbi:uncharacterized protein LOC128201064 [Galleria mellonella]|uniref:Uncharacterized protein LOC128201064 n=1 Tax=Galleria mellonella TaxID=7137 RepID=A0ABM3MML8_GALME|nr:uncharacterized protein LOC128201064 [Galleria mellonella]